MKRACASALLAVAWSACVPDAGRPDRTADNYRLIVTAEDSRPVDDDALAVLLNASDLEDPFLRRIAVRALGRLEDPELAPRIARHLDDPVADVRATAAEALAQSVHGQGGGAALVPLLDRALVESDAAVRGTLARSLGRLSVGEADSRLVVSALVALSREGLDEPAEVLEGVALGLESLVRRSGEGGVDRAAADRLVDLMTFGLADGEDAAASAGHIRGLAASTLGRTRRLSLDLIRQAVDDPEPEVRRAVLPYLIAVPPSRRQGLLDLALADPSARVVTAAVGYLAALPRTDERCGQLIDVASAGRAPAARIPALTALGQACPSIGAQRAALLTVVGELGEPGLPWQPAAHALTALARVDPPRAVTALPSFAAHEIPFVRGYAARAAAALRHGETLSELSTDPSPNVRADAARGLFAIEGHELDDYLIEQLEDDDPQLLMTAAGLLEGAPDRFRVARAAVGAFTRISRAERETWRDPRMALLERVSELGDASLAARLRPYLEDYDPVVAATVADLLTSWTGRVHLAEPQPLPRTPVPTMPERRAMERSSLILHMADGATLVIDLLADQATTNVARLVRLADAGYYDGLTFHRWAPNFVIQGGSPGANEYQGDGPYTRDEVGGMPHWRGTVGLSTRGRDTGDAQIFINLVDNPRLDHDYTVMGVLVEGYEALDSILEGAVIERAEVVRAR